MGLSGFRSDPVQICDTQGYSGALADRWQRMGMARNTNTAKLLKYLQRQGTESRASPSPSICPLPGHSEGGADSQSLSKWKEMFLHHFQNLCYAF